MSKNSGSDNKKKEIISKYNSTSEFYDRRYFNLQQDKYNLILNDIALNEKLILDAGCGTGLLFEYILNSSERCGINYFHFVGVDISFNMLKKFQLKLSYNAKRMKNNINLILSDLENLPLRGSVFNVLLSFTSLQNLPDVTDGLKEIFRVGKNGADVTFSILRKKVKKERLNCLLKPLLKQMNIIDIESIEDILFTGKALKE